MSIPPKRGIRLYCVIAYQITYHRMRILLIEDDLKLCQIITEAFNLEQFTVDTSLDGNAGFEKAKNRKYDVIVLDIMLPNRSGFEIISGLRSLGIKTPVLIISARTTVQDRVLGLDLGADDYLIKNFSLAELISRVKALYRRQGNEASNIIRCNDLLVNLSNLVVTREGQEITLTKKELGILMQLIKHKNKVVSRENLVEAVWGDKDADVMSNTIDVHIRMLRAKVDKPFKIPLVQTVRGYGYIIRCESS